MPRTNTKSSPVRPAVVALCALALACDAGDPPDATSTETEDSATATSGGEDAPSVPESDTGAADGTAGTGADAPGDAGEDAGATGGGDSESGGGSDGESDTDTGDPSGPSGRAESPWDWITGGGEYYEVTFLATGAVVVDPATGAVTDVGGKAIFIGRQTLIAVLEGEIHNYDVEDLGDGCWLLTTDNPSLATSSSYGSSAGVPETDLGPITVTVGEFEGQFEHSEGYYESIIEGLNSPPFAALPGDPFTVEFEGMDALGIEPTSFDLDVLGVFDVTAPDATPDYTLDRSVDLDVAWQAQTTGRVVVWMSDRAMGEGHPEEHHIRCVYDAASGAATVSADVLERLTPTTSASVGIGHQHLERLNLGDLFVRVRTYELAGGWSVEDASIE